MKELVSGDDMQKNAMIESKLQILPTRTEYRQDEDIKDALFGAQKQGHRVIVGPGKGKNNCRRG